MKKTINIGNYLLRVQGSLHVDRKVADMVGVQSICEDGKHVIFLDFDNCTLRDVIRKCNVLQEHYGIGIILIMQSSKGNYHGICFDKVSFGNVVDMQMELDMKPYIMASVPRGHWVMRVSPKKEKIRFVCIIGKDNHGRYISSRAHYEFFATLNDTVKRYKPKRIDTSSKVGLDLYTTLEKRKA